MQDPLPPADDSGFDRRLVGWLADVAEIASHVVRHGGACGERFLCDNPDHRADGYARVEMFGPGTLGHAPGELIFHCEGPEATLRPGDLRYNERRGGLLRREPA